ncbi:NAD(P)/FAD-dependent oxidoreductase [Flavobacterium sp. NG2]|uniref:NAD(P)/FAD-dependent oxidoreductase n=1 Tax=Flavobacterium sp. NG2 TaxID=3097547 RepID=UPI002A8013E6|nr:NAD(P)/FAD-dependent oxidoreductase [Flavobacterium sp. NG2]WPR70320.1 NAD(P)/FAD-dependent oxidoreductase [Flavobacterium sp. NG2]
METSIISQQNIARRKFIKQAGFGLLAITFPFPFKKNSMKTKTKQFDVIIIGGSYSGLAAGMALGRALKKVLIIDSGKPCNAQTPHSHNFLTQDGNTPKAIADLGKKQVEEYPNVEFFNGIATSGSKFENGFEITTEKGEKFRASKLIFATGIKDSMPQIEGFAESWGISVIHCPYCHGYEVRNTKTGILANGDYAYEFSILISNWTSDLKIFTNGKSTLIKEQQNKLKKHNISIIEKEIDNIEHIKGYIQNLVFKDGTKSPLTALYAPRPFVQHCAIPEALGCTINDEGYIKVNAFQETSVEGIYACGDNTTRLRTVANAVAMGTATGMAVSKKMIFEQF